VAFESLASDLIGIGGDTNGLRDIFVHDRDTDADGIFDEPAFIKTVRVSVSSTGAQATTNNSFAPSISSTGRYVAFESLASDLIGIGGDTNGLRDIFVHDRDTDADGIFDEAGFISTVRVSVDTGGSQSITGNSSTPSISSTGRFVTFESLARDLIAGDTNGLRDVFFHDRDTDGDGIYDEPGAISTVRVSLDTSGVQANNSSFAPSISPDGKFVAFESMANNLVTGDTNGLTDIFVRTP
jgi:Tol biopolymer transport system component